SARTVGAQDQKIEIRIGCQLTTPEAARCQDRDRRRTFDQMWAGDRVHDGVDVRRELARDRNSIPTLAHGLAGTPPYRSKLLRDRLVHLGALYHPSHND